MIYWFCGQPASGKTTLAQAFIDGHCDNETTIHIDGDKLREILCNDDYSKEGRFRNLQSVLDIARFMDSKGYDVVISVVAPYNYHRQSLKETNKMIEIYVHTTEIRGREHFFANDFEKPIDDYIDIDTTNVSIEDSLDKLLHHIYYS